MPQEVTVRRTELSTPDLEDPTKITLQIQYQVGELPPGFVYLNKKDWTKEKEAKLIKEDMTKRLGPTGEKITI